MDQERFDELAKGLATSRLSRGQVLKGFVAGVLLAGPLGAFAKPAWAGEVVPSCRSICRKLFSSPIKRRKCQKACGGVTCPPEIKCSSIQYSDTEIQMFDGGCGTYFHEGGPGPYEALCDKDFLNPDFSKLRRYLFSKGFRDAGELEGFVTENDQFTLYEEVLVARLAKKTTGEKAIIRYGDDREGTKSTYAVVTKGGVGKYVLFVNKSGEVAKRLAGDFTLSGAAASIKFDPSFAYATSSVSDNPWSPRSPHYGAHLCEYCEFQCNLAFGGAGVVFSVLFSLPGWAAASLGVLSGTFADKLACKKNCAQQIFDVTQHDNFVCGGCPAPGQPGVVCDTLHGQQCCKGECVSTFKPANCGGCGNVCGSGINAHSPTCCTNVCTNLEISPNHCGECHNPCLEGQICDAGKCRCLSGQELCNDKCIDKCPAGQRRNPSTCVCEQVPCADLPCPADCNDCPDCCIKQCLAIHGNATRIGCDLRGEGSCWAAVPDGQGSTKFVTC